MYAATMTNDQGYGPSTSVLRRINSFEDETENLYHSDLTNTRRIAEGGIQSTLLEATNAIKMETDDCETMAIVNPALITGQSLAMKMEVDKMKALQPFDLDAFVNDQAASVVRPPVEETHCLIREMEDFLSQYEDDAWTGSAPVTEDIAKQLLSMEQQQTLNSMDTSCPVTNGNLNADEVAFAEELVDELLRKSPEAMDILATAIESENLHDSGYLEGPVEDPVRDCAEHSIKDPVEEASEISYDVSNVSQFFTNEGNVIIVIAPPSDTNSITSSPTREDSDSDWTPEELTQRKKPGRKPSARQPVTYNGGRVTKKSFKTIKDKKERKKMQNVEAARRYRDKKKQEALEVENEEQVLLLKNRSLKDQLKDMENEMKTMKKLMVELGLFKVARR